MANTRYNARKRMKKYIIILSLLIASITFFLYLGKTAIVSTTGKTFAEKVAKKIPNKHKTWIKKTFFKTEFLKLQIRNQNKQLDELLNKERDKNMLVVDKFKKIYFDHPFKITTNNEDYELRLFQTKFLANGKNDFAIASGYIDVFQNNLIIITGDGLLFKVDIEQLSYNEGFFAEIIETNIKEIVKTEDFFKQSYYGIKDLLIIEDKIFLSFSNEVKKDCFNTGILTANLNLNFTNFKRFSFSNTDCAIKGKMDNALQGGRMVKYSDEEIMFTHGDWLQGESAQNKNSIFGKILKFNHFNESFNVVSYGHRNPQGLFYLPEKELLFETEHGPIGGDEINIIELNKNNEKNYGWPIASYGIGTQQTATAFSSGTKKYKSHDGFIEPLKYYVPSIGISQILKVPNKFLPGEEESMNFYIATLGTKISEGDLSLHHLKIDKDSNKIIFEDIIHIQERIRDMIYIDRFNALILFLESDRMQKGGPSIAIFRKIK